MAPTRAAHASPGDASGRDAVTTIALDLEYEAVSAFIALFRRTFGVTPTKYFSSSSDSA
jgi:AraC-like DNA-binding protein